MLLSIIIPTLNESAHLPRLLEQLLAFQGLEMEIIVSDGGSSDSTLLEAQKFSVKVLNTDKGRAVQMNQAAKIAKGDYFLFLHADSQIGPETNFTDSIHWFTDEQSDYTVGHFGLYFRSENPDLKKYEYWERKTLLNRPRVINGDQGLLISRNFYEILGGHDERLPFMEDQEISRRIFQRGKWVSLPGRLITSPRRFEAEGLSRRMLLSATIVAVYDVQLWEFFDYAPQIYREQNQTNKLRIDLFFQMAWKIQMNKGAWGFLKLWYAIGREVQPESWQIGHYLDWKFGFNKRRPFTWFFDYIFIPITNNFLCFAVSGVLTFLFYLMAWRYFSWKDRAIPN